MKSLFVIIAGVFFLFLSFISVSYAGHFTLDNKTSSELEFKVINRSCMDAKTTLIPPDKPTEVGYSIETTRSCMSPKPSSGNYEIIVHKNFYGVNPNTVICRYNFHQIAGSKSGSKVTFSEDKNYKCTNKGDVINILPVGMPTR